MLKRNPDLILKKQGNDKPYLNRWWVIPRNRYFNIYLHKFEQSDDDRALHDHPWWSLSILLKGEVLEHQLSNKRLIPWLIPIVRSAKMLHRLEIIKGPVWTIFITGPRIRQWGFLTKNGWKHHLRFIKEESDMEEIK